MMLSPGAVLLKMETNLKDPNKLKSNRTLYLVDLVASCAPRSSLAINGTACRP
jgi:hypothetical protein